MRMAVWQATRAAGIPWMAAGNRSKAANSKLGEWKRYQYGKGNFPRIKLSECVELIYQMFIP